jgi:chorismate mutase
MRENPGPLDPTAVKRVFERIIDESRRLERLAGESAETGAGTKDKE